MMWICVVFFFFKQKTAYEMRISDWSSDVCSSDLGGDHAAARGQRAAASGARGTRDGGGRGDRRPGQPGGRGRPVGPGRRERQGGLLPQRQPAAQPAARQPADHGGRARRWDGGDRSEEPTSELQSLLRIFDDVFYFTTKKDVTP